MIFMDCRPDCDQDYIKTELPFLHFVRDKEEANLYLLITTRDAGNGGKEMTLTFVGHEDFEGVTDTLKFVTRASDTDDMIRAQLIHTMKLGLVRYMAKTPLADRTEVSLAESSAPPAERIDSWDYWVMSTYLAVKVYREKSTGNAQFEGSLYANRITESSKVRIGAEGTYAENDYTLPEQSYKSVARSRAVRALGVVSLGRHWSAGVFGSASASTYDNTAFWLSVAPALEYDLFPYDESTRRECRFLYRIGSNWLNYYSETIYYQTKERLYSHSLEIALDVKEPWGRASASLLTSQYLHDLTKNRLEFSGELSVRVVEGLSLNLSGVVSLIHDQLMLPRLDATPEEILLQRRELATTYSYYTSIGFSYTFGSIYSDIVNPRFGK